MEQTDLSRSIRATFEGPDIGHGWVPVPGLLAVLDGLQNAITIVMEDLWGRAHTRGRVPLEIQGPATFRFGHVRAGSFGATLQLERPPTGHPELFDMQPRAVDRLMEGIEAHVRGQTSDLPAEANRHIANVTVRIRNSPDSLVLEGGPRRRRVILSASTVATRTLSEEAPRPRKVRLKGRLLEIDYRDRSAEIWDPTGQMTRIRFREDQRALVDGARQQQVAAVGVVETGPSGRSGPVDLENLTAISTDDSFWRTQHLSQVAAEQGVSPVPEPAKLAASFWEEDDEEEFLAALRTWRQEA